MTENGDERQAPSGGGETWLLRLYIAGQTPRSREAIANLKRICERHLHGKYEVEVIDLKEDPGRSRTDQILATPTLVRRLPPPARKIIGDLSNEEKVLVGLEIVTREEGK